MDSHTHSIALVEITADQEVPIYLTNSQDSVNHESRVYMSSPDMVLKIPKHTGDLSAEEGRIENVEISTVALAVLAGMYPYNRIEVVIKEAELAADLTPVIIRTHFTGLVYQIEAGLGTGYMTLVAKGWKYYTDVVGGMPCTEYCMAPYFGDAKFCKKTRIVTSVVVLSISGYDVTLAATPPGQDFLYNRGFFSRGGTSISIKYWESGAVFQTSELMPASWEALTISVSAGCDRSIRSCRDIHDNEARFSGWGIAMVDYNPQTERATIK